MMMATMAAMAVGGMAFMSSAATVAHMKGGSAVRVDDDDETARDGEGRKRRRTGEERQARSMAASHEERARRGLACYRCSLVTAAMQEIENHNLDLADTILSHKGMENRQQSVLIVPYAKARMLTRNQLI